MSLVHRLAVLACCTAASLPAQVSSVEYTARRAALLAPIDSGVVLVPGARDPVFHWPSFHQFPSFRYLTGYLNPDATLVLIKRGGLGRGVLIVPATNPRTTLYDGRTTDAVALGRAMGVEVRHPEALAPLLDSLAALPGLPLYFLPDVQADEFNGRDSLTFGKMLVRGLRARTPSLVVRDATPLVNTLRAKRSPAELALLRTSIAISDSGHLAALRTIAPGRTEFEVQAAIEHAFRRLGADRPAYASIVGSGANSTVLHYDAGNRVMQAGDVVLMDVAAEYEGYSADITRTVPVTGVFSADQKAIYQIVLNAQKAGEATIKPGTPRDASFDAGIAVIKQGLTALGLIESPDATFDAPAAFCPERPPFRKPGEACPQWYLYTYHGFSHGIGLDVHDPAQFANVAPFTFQVGDGFTIEPGVYVRANALEGLADTPRNRAMAAKLKSAVARYQNIGVRIEDDYYVTPTGVERVSRAPREVSDIEQAMKAVPKRKAM